MTSYSFSKCREDLLSSIVMKYIHEFVDKNNEYVCYIALANNEVFEISYNLYIKNMNRYKNEINIDKNKKILYIIEDPGNKEIDNLLSEFKDYDNLILVFYSKNGITNNNIDKKYNLSDYNYIDNFFKFSNKSKNTNKKMNIFEKLDRTPLKFLVIMSVIECLLVFLEYFFHGETKNYIYGFSIIIIALTLLTIITGDYYIYNNQDKK